MGALWLFLGLEWSSGCHPCWLMIGSGITLPFLYMYIYIHIYIYGIITIQGSWNPVLNKPVSQGLENTHPLHFCELRIFNLDLSPFPELSISLLMIVDISHDRSNKVPQCSCDI
jgi:hypothetical protein